MRGKSLILIGYPQCGKTTVGKSLSQVFRLPFIDLDDRIEQRYCKSSREIFFDEGELYFRTIESKLVEELSKGDLCVIATGGGTVLSNKNNQILKGLGVLIYLRCPYHVLKQRIVSLNRKTGYHFEEIWKDRQSIYEDAADVVIDIK